MKWRTKSNQSQLTEKNLTLSYKKENKKSLKPALSILSFPDMDSLIGLSNFDTLTHRDLKIQTRNLVLDFKKSLKPALSILGFHEELFKLLKWKTKSNQSQLTEKNLTLCYKKGNKKKPKTSP